MKQKNIQKEEKQEKEGFFKKVFKFLKKFWFILIVPFSFILKSFLSSSSKKEIKEDLEEIKEDKEEVGKTQEKVKSTEKELQEEVLKAKDLISKGKEEALKAEVQQKALDASIKDFLPGLNK